MLRSSIITIITIYILLPERKSLWSMVECVFSFAMN